MTKTNEPTCATCETCEGSGYTYDGHGCGVCAARGVVHEGHPGCGVCSAYLRSYRALCAHKEPEGTCLMCATAAETARKAAAYDGLAARVAELESELKRYSFPAGKADQYRAEALACRAALGFSLDGKGDNAATPRDITERFAELERERDAATARAEALEKALRRFLPESHYGYGPEMAECSDACVFDGDDECDEHRPDIGDDMCNAHPSLDERDAVCDRCLILQALDGTSTNPTQHPAYREGMKAGIEKAAQWCDAASSEQGGLDWAAERIRALLEAK